MCFVSISFSERKNICSGQKKNGIEYETKNTQHGKDVRYKSSTNKITTESRIKEKYYFCPSFSFFQQQKKYANVQWIAIFIRCTNYWLFLWKVVIFKYFAPERFDNWAWWWFDKIAILWLPLHTRTHTHTPQNHLLFDVTLIQSGFSSKTVRFYFLISKSTNAIYIETCVNTNILWGFISIVFC